MQLRRVVELAGMNKHCDFGAQITGADSQVWPGQTVRPLEDRTVVKDAQAPTAANLDARLSVRSGNN